MPSRVEPSHTWERAAIAHPSSGLGLAPRGAPRLQPRIRSSAPRTRRRRICNSCYVIPLQLPEIVPVRARVGAHPYRCRARRAVSCGSSPNCEFACRDDGGWTARRDNQPDRLARAGESVSAGFSHAENRQFSQGDVAIDGRLDTRFGNLHPGAIVVSSACREKLAGDSFGAGFDIRPAWAPSLNDLAIFAWMLLVQTGVMAVRAIAIICDG